MAGIVSREKLNSFYQAYFYHDAAGAADLLHDDVVWTLSGPVGLLSYCGSYRGKAAVMDLVGRVVPAIFKVFNFVQDSVLMDGDRVATLNRLSGRRCADDRVISYRLAHFLRFRDGKVIENLSLMDSFNAAEQVLGRSFDVQGEGAALSGELVAV
jgi:ketosteroid isomerase-like protein